MDCVRFFPNRVYLISSCGPQDELPHRLMCRKRLKHCIIFTDVNNKVFTFPFVKVLAFDRFSKLSGMVKQEMCISGTNTRIFSESWIDRNPQNLLDKIVK